MKNNFFKIFAAFVLYLFLVLLVSAWSFLLTMGAPGPFSTLNAYLRSVLALTSPTAPSTPLKTTVGKYILSMLHNEN